MFSIDAILLENCKFMFKNLLIYPNINESQNNLQLDCFQQIRVRLLFEIHDYSIGEIHEREKK